MKLLSVALVVGALTITFDQVRGFGLFMIRAVLNGRGDELIDLARTNLLR
jgi:pyruvate dehydrogenase (quinone)